MNPHLDTGRTSKHDGDDAEPVAARPQDDVIGALIRGKAKLSPSQITEVLAYQRDHRMRFGEAAVALGLASREDVLHALSRQFQYPYSPFSPISPVGHYQELVVATHPFGEEAEAFRELRSQLLAGALAPEEPRRALAVMSQDVGDGKTFIAANLAVAFSQLGGHTLLIDLDMRSPRQHEVFHVDNQSGLSNILSGRSEANVIRKVKDLPTLFVLPVGNLPPNPLELVQRPALGLLINELLSKFDHIIVDTPAASRGSDARVIATKCGAALAVGREGRSRLRAMQKVLGSLARSPVTLAGVVVNEH